MGWSHSPGTARIVLGCSLLFHALAILYSLPGRVCLTTNPILDIFSFLQHDLKIVFTTTTTSDELTCSRPMSRGQGGFEDSREKLAECDAESTSPCTVRLLHIHEPEQGYVASHVQSAHNIPVAQSFCLRVGLRCTA